MPGWKSSRVPSTSPPSMSQIGQRGVGLGAGAGGRLPSLLILFGGLMPPRLLEKSNKRDRRGLGQPGKLSRASAERRHFPNDHQAGTVPSYRIHGDDRRT